MKYKYLLPNIPILYFHQYKMLKSVEYLSHCYLSTVDINPNTAHAYFNRANLYKSYQQYNLAEEDYKTG